MFAPRRCGLRYDPPTLVLDYVIVSTGKLRRRAMPLKDFKEGLISVEELTAQIKKSKHAMYLENVSSKQLQRLLERLKSHVGKQDAPSEREQAQGDSGSSLPNSPSPVGGHQINLELDLNKLSDSELEKHKAAMEVLFEANRKRPDDDGFVYDVEVDFNKEGRMESGWDNEDNDEDDEF